MTYRFVTSIRGILVSMIYTKTVDLSVTALDESAAVTLMASDTGMWHPTFRNCTSNGAWHRNNMQGLYQSARTLGSSHRIGHCTNAAWKAIGACLFSACNCGFCWDNRHPDDGEIYRKRAKNLDWRNPNSCWCHRIDTWVHEGKSSLWLNIDLLICKGCQDAWLYRLNFQHNPRSSSHWTPPISPLPKTTLCPRVSR